MIDIKCFVKYGDSHRGVDWPVEEDVYKRYDVMLGVIQEDGKEPFGKGC